MVLVAATFAACGPQTTSLAVNARPAPTVARQAVKEWEVYGTTRSLYTLPVPDRHCPDVRWLAVAPWFAIHLSGAGTYTDIDSHTVAGLDGRTIDTLACDYLHVTGYDRDGVPTAPSPQSGDKLTAVTSYRAPESIQQATTETAEIRCGNEDTTLQIAKYYDYFPLSQRAAAINMVQFNGYRRVVLVMGGSRRLLLDVRAWTPGPKGGEVSPPDPDCAPPQG